MIKSRGLNHLNLNVSDIQRSLRFYQEAFGLEVRFWEGQRMVFLGSPGGRDLITLCEVDQGAPIGSGTPANPPTRSRDRVEVMRGRRAARRAA